VSDDVHHVLAPSVASDDRTRVLKHADAFGVFDHHGDIVPGGLGEQGLYSRGTRHLSRWLLDLQGVRPFFLGATIRDEADRLATSFTNPDLMRDGIVRMPLGTIHLVVQKFLWRDVLHQRVTVTSYADATLDIEVTVHFQADFADIFEVRGMRRPLRGVTLAPTVAADRVELAYRGRDALERRTALEFSPAPHTLGPLSARFLLRVEPKRERSIEISVACDRSTGATKAPSFEKARVEAESHRAGYRSRSCHARTPNERVNAWIDRAIDDLHMLTTELDTGPYPYAGVPWFNTPFGRDGVLTAFECLWARPELGQGVLRYLAATQARSDAPEEDAEPGKILHETRAGEMARAGEMPFRRYYGSVDATPLFVMLAGEHLRRTGDLELARSLWPNVKAALEWIERFGDRDGDGFVEYERRSPGGILHQGWKDSDDAIMHADGSRARGAIALAEVQGYAYAAWRAGAAIASELGMPKLADGFDARAERLAARFDAAFWCDELETYALALDGEKRPCRVRTSNAGQCLFTGITRPDRSSRIAATLMAPESFSGWGVRTLASNEECFNPMGYHTGAVWPHDNALVALGLTRCGHTAAALEIFSGLLAAGLCFDLERMPELFCGFDRAPGEGPVLYPVACAPQAWAAGSVLLLLQAILGLEVDARRGRVVLTRPQLPVGLDEIRIHSLQVCGSTLDFVVCGERRDVMVKVLRCEGDVPLIVVP
jgi:glycogen debranching enzyme